jgi:hypothetical protein
MFGESFRYSAIAVYGIDWTHPEFEFDHSS